MSPSSAAIRDASVPAKALGLPEVWRVWSGPGRASLARSWGPYVLRRLFPVLWVLPALFVAEATAGQQNAARSDSTAVLEGGKDGGGGGDGEGRADLELRLVGPERATMGDAVAYEIRVRNAGPDRGRDVAFRFHIPDGAEFVSATGGGERDGSRVRFPKLDRLAKGDAVFDTVTVRYPEPGRYVARAAVEGSTADPDRSNNEDDEPTTVSLPFKADLQVAKTGPGTASVGEEVRFLITTTNLGPDLADWVDVTDHLPEGAEFVRANRQHVVEGRTVRWEMIHEIHAGESVQDTVWVVFPEPGEYVNRAEVDQLTEDPRSDNDRASTTVTIEGGGGTGGGDGADLEMRMVGRERATIGETISYELRVRNLGPDPALAVRVQHTVPDGGTFVRATGGGMLDGDGVVAFPERARLDAGSQVFDTVFVRYDAPGRFVNRASVGSDTSDPDPSNNEDDEPTTVSLPFKADLQVAKTGPATARAGDEIRFLITTTNLGPDLADWVDVTDHLPEGAGFVRANRQHVVDGRTVRWEMIHEIHAGESVQDTVWVVFPEPGEYVNRAEVDQLTEDPESGNDHSSATVIIEGGGDTGGRDGADLEMRMVAPERATVGDVVPYELRVRNLGPDPALAVRVRNTVPEGGIFVRATGEGTLGADGVVDFPERARLDAGGQVFDTVFVRYDETGRFINQARADSDTSDPDPSNNEDDEPTTVGEIPVADLQVVKTGDPDTVAVGDTVTYLITTTNLGPDLADWVYVEDILPEGAQFVDANREFTQEGRNIRWEMIHIIDPGDSVQDTVRVVYDSTGTYVNTAAVSQLTHDPTAQNDTSHATTVVVDDSARVDLALDHTVRPPQVNVGDTAVFTLAVSNLGADSTLGAATVKTVLDTGRVSYYQASGPQWLFELDGDTLVATYEARLAPGASASFDVRVVAADTGRAVHPAVVSTPSDSNVANDTATATLTIGDPQGPDPSSLLLTKRALTTDLEIGDPVTYVLEVENRGSVAFTDVTVRDEPASGFRFRRGTVTLDGRGIEDPVVAPDSMTFAVGRVEPGARRTLTYRMFVGANARVGPATNTARAIDRATEVTSLPASAVVNVRDQGVFTEEAMILGRVWAQIDSVPLGIPGVRVYLQDGTSAITDGEGNYSFIGLRPRLWVVRVDQSTLPPAVDLKPISSRNAGQGSSAFADLVRGEMHRVDFGAYESAEDTLWYVAETEVRNRRRMAREAEADGRGGITWPLFNGWMRDSTDARALPGLPSAFGDILPPGSLNGGNSNLGPRPADPISAGLMGRWADRGAGRTTDASIHCWESESEFCLSLDPASLPIARGDSTVVVRVS
ncbi:MAG: DUF11 domain-containing protein, partial [Gemmatimonadetes bacterium]|nr:DUF11 domain-containing protein [Gemmatimonadota bacterium]